MELRIRLVFFTTLFFLQQTFSFAADRFWVGGSGSWNDPAHWSTVSNGQGGASVPSVNDNVFFDNFSFTSDRNEILIPGNIQLNNFNFSSAQYNPKIKSTTPVTITVGGNWQVSGMFRNYITGTIAFTNPSSAQINSGNIHFRSNLQFSNGNFVLGNDLELEPNNNIEIISGTFKTSGHAVKCDEFIFGTQAITFNTENSDLVTVDPIVITGTNVNWLNSGTRMAQVVDNPDNLPLRLTATCGTAPNQFTITASVTTNYNGQHVSCNGAHDAQVCVTVTGGIGPFDIQWLGGGPAANCWSGLGAGTYTIRVIDQGPNPDVICATTVTVVEPGDLTVLSWSTTDPSCNNTCDGTASPFVFGGTPNYTFTWSSGETGNIATQLCIGLNSMNVTDANGCSFDTTFFILTPLAISPNLVAVDASCFGVCDGSITANPTGGNGAPYTYSWSNGGTNSSITGLCDGTYSVTVFDANNCPQAANAIVNEPQPIIITLTNQTNLICNGICSGSLTVSASNGTAPYTYQWFTSPGGLPLAGQTNPTASGLCAGSYYVIVTDANGCSMQSAVFTLTQPTAVNPTTTATPALCHDACSGSLSGSAVGGTSPYTFTWINAATGIPIGTGNPFNGVCPGTYFAQVQDGNGCIVNSTPPVTVNNPPALVLGVDPNDAVCHNDCNGSAVVTQASGGTGALNVTWFNSSSVQIGAGNSITNLCTGTYSATLTDINGCSEDSTFVINDPDPFTFTLTTTNVTCIGSCNGTATLSGIAGQTSPYIIDWSSSANSGLTENNLCAGNYSVIITDVNGCDTSATFSIGNPVALVLNPTSSNPSCSGVCDGSATANASGGDGTYTYSWFNQPSGTPLGQATDPVIGLCDGSYSVTVTDGAGCTATASYTLTDPVTVTATATATTSNCGICDGTTTVVVSGGTPPYTIVWIDATTLNPTGNTGLTATNVCSGSYFAMITDANGCIINSNTVAVTDNVIITASGNGINPSCFGFCNGVIDITVAGGTPPYTFAWFDQVTNLPIGQSTEDAVGLCEGTYYVDITDVNGCSPAPIVITLTEPNLLTLTATGTNPTCFGVCNGIGNANPSGGTAPYSYAWVDQSTGTTVSTVQNPNNLCEGCYALTVTDANGCTAGPVTIDLIAPPAMNVSLSSTNATCFNVCNGTATVTVTGGLAPISVTWSSSANTGTTENGLCDGNYTVTVTDATGCSSTPLNFTITEPTQLTAATTGGTLLCFGDCNGSASVTANGGTSPYSYQWSAGAGNQTTPVASSLCAGTYSVVVTDANGCTAGPLNATLTQPTQLTANLSSTNAQCSGVCDGTATVNAAGGTAPYTFGWNDALNQNTATAISLCAGAYSVTVTDANGCVLNPPAVTITEPSVLSVSATSVSTLCNASCDGTATVSVSGGTAPFTVLWDDPAAQSTLTANSLCAGTYNVQVTDANGCSGNASVTVNEPTALDATLSSTLATCSVCDGTATVNPSGGTAPYTVQWDAAAANQVTTTANSLCAGPYNVTVTDNNNCVAVFTAAVSNINGETLTLTSTDVSCFGSCNGSVDVTFNCLDPVCTILWNDPSASTSNTVNNLCAGTYAVSVTNNTGCITVATVDVNEPALLQANATSTDVLCFGNCNGTGTVTPSGGTAPYTVQWNAAAANQTTSTAFNLCTGNYSVVVTDANGCTANDNVSISEPTPLSATTSFADASCNSVCDGTGTAFPSGGTAPFSYQWDDPANQTTQQASGLCAGQYVVTVFDANGCTFIPAQISIDEPDAILVSVSATSLNCFGDCNGTATANVSGGTAPYSYSWNDPLNQTTALANNLCSGSYDVTITDVNGCLGGPASVTLAAPSQITATFTTSSPQCNGDCNGSIVANVNGGTLPYTLQWNDPASSSTSTVVNLCAGNYLLSVTDANGCNSNLSASITAPASLNLQLSSTNSSCFNACNGTVSSNPTGGTAPYTFSWSNGGNTNSINGLCPGVYSVTVTDANGCTDNGSRNITEPSEIILSSGNAPASCGVCNGTVSVSPSGGVPGYSYQWSANAANQTTQSAGNLCAGIYTVTVTDASGCSTNTAVALSNINGETLTMSTTDASCFEVCDGNATGTTACNNGPCAFTWFDGTTGLGIGQSTATAIGLCAGDYILQLSNQPGCITFGNVTIDEPTEIISNFIVTDPSCNASCNGSITISPSGGTGPYTQQWDAAAGNSTNATVNGLCAGDYIVTMSDATGCSRNDTITLTAPILLSVTSSANDVLCNGDCNGIANSSISGGTLPYTISWNDPSSQSTSSAIGLCAGSYSVTVTDASGCTSTSSVTINEPTALSASTSSTDNTCFGDCSGTATATVNGGTSPYSFLWDDPSAQNTSTANGLCAGTYSVIIGDASNCTIAPLTVTINNPAQVDFTVTSTDVSCNGACSGSITVVPSGGNGVYLVSVDGGATFQNATVFNSLCAGAYSVIVMDGNNCSSNAQNVNINEPTALTASTSFFPADCNVNNGAATINPSGGTPNYSIVWFDALLNPLGQTTNTAINVGAGIYIAEVTDANGCTDQFPVTVNNTVSPQATAVITNVSCNANFNGAIDATPVSGTAPYSYLWFPGGQTAEDISSLCAGGYMLQITDANGCIGFSNFSVTEPSALQAAFVVTDAACGQCNGTIAATANGGTGSYSFDWSNGQTGTTATGLCAGAYMVQVTDNSGCSQTFNTGLNNIGGPTGENITQTNVSCFGLCDGDASVSPIGGTAPYSYYWIHDGSTTNAISNLCAGTYFLEVTDTNGCVRVTDVTITEPVQLSDSVVVFPATCGLCDGTLSVFVQGGTAPFNYQWDAAAGGATTSLVSNLCQGIYNVTVTDGNGCSTTIVNTVNGNNAPQLTLSNTDVTCQGNCDGTSAVVINGGTAPYTQDWLTNAGVSTGQSGTSASNFCAGDYILEVTDAAGCIAFAPFTLSEPDSLLFSLPFTQSPSCFNTCDGIAVAIVIEGTLPYGFSWNDPSSQTTATAINMCAGSYVVTVTDGNGCTSTQSVTVDAPLAITLLLDSTDASCSTVADGAINATPSGGAGGFIFSWTGPNGFTANTEDLTNIFSGTYFITVTDANGCSLKDSIVVGAILVVDANAGNDTSLCMNNVTGITLTGSGGVTYEWYDLAGNLLSSSNVLNVTPLGGTTSYILVANNSGCLDRDTVDVSVNPLPFVSAGPDVDIILNTSTVIGGSPTTSATNTVVWVPSVGLDDSTAFNPNASPDSSTTYIVYATDLNGCVNSDTMRVQVFPDISFPNGFSPNGDGTNDVWVIDFIDMFPDCQVEVYNRWGQLLFLSVGYHTPWDGTYNNQPVPVGTYYYIINLNHPLYPDAFTGPLTVLR
ncbi:MAG: gliding motility-associated C-terminal domain-containing protein [Flavobacteriales bacterium]|nr:gliding motility-associated C-terminal domain-containing protein [Flavobacteriales bacterium]